MESSVPSGSRSRALAVLVLGIAIGLVIGVGGFRSIEPRSLLAWRTCDQGSCLRLNEVTGLVAALGLKLPAEVVPSVVRETPYSLVVRHPFPEARVHYLVIPKKYIKNIGELSDDDKVYLLDAFATMQDIIKQEHLQTYIIKTNGPGYQDVAYLHFHLMAK